MRIELQLRGNVLAKTRYFLTFLSRTESQFLGERFESVVNGTKAQFVRCDFGQGPVVI